MMSERQPVLTTQKRDHSEAAAQEAARTTLPASRQPPRWSARRRRDGLFLLGVLLLSMVTILVLANTGSSQRGQATTAQSGSSPAPVTQTLSTTTSSLIATGMFREYPFPQSNSQVMRLAVDHEGRLWMGEMGRNALAVFDPRTQAFQEVAPPHGRYGIMGIQVAADDTIWFAEQYANYIGHYLPATRQFRLFPLPTITTPDPSNASKTLTLPSAPNDLVLDSHGEVWFAEFNADRLGRLDPHTGLMRHYPLSAKRSVQTLAPFGVAVDPQGMVWFTEMSTGQVGRLDPATGRLRFFPVPVPKVAPMEIASDAHGIIWVTSFNDALLLRLDPRTITFTSYHASSTGNGTGGLYGLVVTPAGEVWVTILAENTIAHLDVAAKRFVYYPIPTPGSEPLAMAMGPDHTLWFN